MFFENSELCFQILDVVKISQKNVRCLNSGRYFNALSYRFSANSKLIASGVAYEMHDRSICFVPSNLDYTRISEYEELVAVHFHIVNGSGDRIECFSAEDTEKMASLFETTYEVWNTKASGYAYRCHALFYEIMSECHLRYAAKMETVSPIARSTEYLLKSFEDPALTIGTIAEKSFISEVYFRKLFRKEFGMSPQKYITKLRMERAIRLLSAGYYSLTEIAHMSGYRDYKYFLTEFKRFTGVTPSNYKYVYDALGMQASKN